MSDSPFRWKNGPGIIPESLRRRALAVPLIGVTVFLAGCSLRFDPESLGTSEYYIHDRNNVFCTGLDRTSLAARVGERAIDPRNEVIVGYDNIVYRGSDPFPCNTSHMTQFSGRVRYVFPRELSAEANRRGIVAAELNLQRRSTGVPIVAFDEDGERRYNAQCGFDVVRSPSAWTQGYSLTGEHVGIGTSIGRITGDSPSLGSFLNSDSISSATAIRVTSPALVDYVRRLVSGDVPNNGFDIIPNPENGQVMRGLSNSTCTGIFVNIQLVITIG